MHIPTKLYQFLLNSISVIAQTDTQTHTDGYLL